VSKSKTTLSSFLQVSPVTIHAYMHFSGSGA
jgi:hypothetical protein